MAHWVTFDADNFAFGRRFRQPLPVHEGEDPVGRQHGHGSTTSLGSSTKSSARTTARSEASYMSGPSGSNAWLPRRPMEMVLQIPHSPVPLTLTIVPPTPSTTSSDSWHTTRSGGSTPDFFSAASSMASSDSGDDDDSQGNDSRHCGDPSERHVRFVTPADEDEVHPDLANLTAAANTLMDGLSDVARGKLPETTDDVCPDLVDTSPTQPLADEPDASPCTALVLARTTFHPRPPKTPKVAKPSPLRQVLLPDNAVSPEDLAAAWMDPTWTPDQVDREWSRRAACWPHIPKSRWIRESLNPFYPEGEEVCYDRAPPPPVPPPGKVARINGASMAADIIAEFKARGAVNGKAYPKSEHWFLVDDISPPSA